MLCVCPSVWDYKVCYVCVHQYGIIRCLCVCPSVWDYKVCYVCVHQYGIIRCVMCVSISMGL